MSEPTLVTLDCRICGHPTKCGFNLDFKLVPICELCANAITGQQIDYLLKREITKALFKK